MVEIPNNGPYFHGNLVEGSELDEKEKEKSKEYHEKRIPPELKDRYYSEGWIFERQVRDSIIIRKDKEIDELLEDNVWVLFKNLGFDEMNKDRNFKINISSRTKQIDIFAKDDQNAFVIFCTSQKENGQSASLKGKIHEISDLKGDISKVIQGHYNKKIRVSFIVVTKNILWNETDENVAHGKNISVWKEEDIESYKFLIEQLGVAAKYQMYAVLFGNKKSSEVGEIQVPAMRGGKGKNRYYCFLINPEKLFRIAYVHRREKSNPKEIGIAYQRIVSKKRLDNIAGFINGGNSFPNNIILSFRQKPIFEPNEKVKEIQNISYGILKFPPYYGCAWIIDGQHRLYGYSKSQHASDHTIPVIAFETLSVKDQANLFVDINQEQKAVNQNLLWELYPDIYEGSEDETQKQLRTISLIAKNLAEDEKSIFYNRIQIPSKIIEDKKTTNLTLTNICDAIKENELINRVLLYDENYENSVIIASRVINAYFEVVYEYLKDDWERGQKGLVRTNIGIRILFITLRQLLRYLDYQGKRNNYIIKNNLDKFKEETRKILGQDLFTKLKEMERQKLDEIRQGSNKQLIKRNTQKLLWDVYQRTNIFGNELWFEEKAWRQDVPQEETDDKIKELIDNTEVELRKLVIKKLEEIHRNEWWKRGVPEDVKTYVDRIIEQDISKTPWKEKELHSMSPEQKIKLTSTSHLSKIIINGNNWNKFEEVFYKDKEAVSVNFRFFEVLRNKHKHPERELDEIERGLGYWCMRWIRRCVGLDIPKILSV